MVTGGVFPPGYVSPQMGNSALPPIPSEPPTAAPSLHGHDSGQRTPRPSHSQRPSQSESQPLLVPGESDEDVLARLHALRAQQNQRDAELDLADLRRLLRTALQAGSDAQMIGVLQVGRDEMPEAIKTLQRALEREVEKSASEGSTGKPVMGLGLEFDDPRRASEPTTRSEKEVVEKGVVTTTLMTVKGIDDGLERRKTVNTQKSATSSTGMTASGSGGSAEHARDTLDREFIESGIDALRRVSNGPGSLPSWTITK